MNKLYLFKPTSLLGYVICLVTGSPYSHAAIEYDGVLYDSSETRGGFARSQIDVTTRDHVAYGFEGDLSGWFDRMEYKKYDWVGALGWMFKCDNPNRFYCFETAWAALLSAGIVHTGYPDYLDGTVLEEVMIRKGCKRL